MIILASCVYEEPDTKPTTVNSETPILFNGLWIRACSQSDNFAKKARISLLCCTHLLDWKKGKINVCEVQCMADIAMPCARGSQALSYRDLTFSHSNLVPFRHIPDSFAWLPWSLSEGTAEIVSSSCGSPGISEEPAETIRQIWR